jgi:hypothetical protein
MFFFGDHNAFSPVSCMEPAEVDNVVDTGNEARRIRAWLPHHNESWHPLVPILVFAEATVFCFSRVNFYFSWLGILGFGSDMATKRLFYFCFDGCAGTPSLALRRRKTADGDALFWKLPISICYPRLVRLGTYMV